MPSTPRAAHPLFVSLPIFWQVLGLSLSVLVLALGVNTLVVLKAPAPQPSGYTIGEAVTALKGGEVRLQNGHRLRGATHDAAPDFVEHPPQMGGLFRDLQQVIRERLSQQLGAPENQIWVSFRPRHEFPRSWDHPHGGFDDHDPAHPSGGGLNFGFPQGRGDVWKPRLAWRLDSAPRSRRIWHDERHGARQSGLSGL